MATKKEKVKERWHSKSGTEREREDREYAKNIAFNSNYCETHLRRINNIWKACDENVSMCTFHRGIWPSVDHFHPHISTIRPVAHSQPNQSSLMKHKMRTSFCSLGASARAHSSVKFNVPIFNLIQMFSWQLTSNRISSQNVSVMWPF